jgi:membrane peptidoglycan carboxypeptidase
VTNIKRGGYKIVTSLDPKLQNEAYQKVVKNVPITDPSHVAAAAATVQPGTGRVLAIAQNRIYTPNPGQGNTQLNYAVDKTLGGSVGFATGSTFKPFTLAAYLAEGKSLNDTVDASQNVRPFSDFKACGGGLGSGTYHFANAGDGENSGAMSVQAATYDSVNTAFVDIESRVDICDIIKIASSLGVHLSSPAGSCGNISGNGVTLDYKKNPLTLPWCYPSLTLGAMSISPLTMAAAYAGFAADGKFCEPRPIVSITDRSGKALPVPAIKCSQAIDPDVAHGVTYALKKVLTQGTAAGKGIGVPAAGKTGTSDASANTWFVGYTHSLSTAVWVADPNSYPKGTPHRQENGQRGLEQIKINGVFRQAFFGATIAGQIWHDFMNDAVSGRDNSNWPDPGSDYLKGGGKVPNVVGQQIGAATAALTGAGFQVKVGGVVQGNTPPGTVARTSPDPGQDIAAGGTITLFISDGSQQGGNGGGPGGGGGGGLPFPVPTKHG